MMRQIFASHISRFLLTGLVLVITSLGFYHLPPPFENEPLVSTTSNVNLNANLNTNLNTNLNSNLNSNPLKVYTHLSYGEIVNEMLRLSATYPTFCSLTTAQELYGVSTGDLTCTRNGVSEPCLQYILTITEHDTLTASPERPELFFSGAVHGDERVGPLAVLELAVVLLQAASHEQPNPWLRRLVQTRSMVLMPITNAWGYDRNRRDENGIDANRDFPYLASGRQCMQTITARSVNEVWRDHLFQLSLTFHGGMRAVSYEWGSTNHYRPSNGWQRQSQHSPDHAGQASLTATMSAYGGAFDDGTFYPHGPMNDIVYGVKGGMEDWGYAASWENDFNRAQPIQTCRPATYGGYPVEKTIYSNATHRAFNILVETSDHKRPTTHSLGDASPLSDSALGAFFKADKAIGHVPRNVRLCLYYIDMVQPYVTWETLTSWKDEQDVILLPFDTVTFHWRVHGAHTVDVTAVTLYTSDPRVWRDEENEENEENEEHAVSPLVRRVGETAGVTHWDTPGAGLFNATVRFETPGTYYLVASAQVDAMWQQQGTGGEAPSPAVTPQSHLVNARTNDQWAFQHHGHTIQGRRIWESNVRRVVVQ